jgi:hypothetical protein
MICSGYYIFLGSEDKNKKILVRVNYLGLSIVLAPRLVSSNLVISKYYYII